MFRERSNKFDKQARIRVTFSLVMTFLRLKRDVTNLTFSRTLSYSCLKIIDSYLTSIFHLYMNHELEDDKTRNIIKFKWILRNGYSSKKRTKFWRYKICEWMQIKIPSRSDLGFLKNIYIFLSVEEENFKEKKKKRKISMIEVVVATIFRIVRIY